MHVVYNKNFGTKLTKKCIKKLKIFNVTLLLMNSPTKKCPLIIILYLAVIMLTAAIIVPVQGQMRENQSLDGQSPDGDCLFNPSLTKCASIDGETCPEGFSMNAKAQCYPREPCPSGFERRDGDETGACYPKDSPTSA